MKTKYIAFAVVLTGLGVFSTSCTDEIKFGNAFLEKAPSGDVTIDTVFHNAEYARQYLTGIYATQYYGLYMHNGLAFPYPNDPYVGLSDALTDTYQDHFTTTVANRYYNGTLNATNTGNRRGNIFRLDEANVWEAVRACNTFMANIGGTPDMEQSEKDELVAEAKCLLAARYFDVFRYYGGVPIITQAFSGSDASYNMKRGSVEECVDFMVKNLDEAIPLLPWTVDVNTQSGRWTKAGAMALKCKILQFAASPLFNSDQPYNTNTTASAEEQKAWWYGNYDKNRWVKCAEACKELLDAIAANGTYKLVEATTKDPATGQVRLSDYRLAYRKGYFQPESPEVLHSVRVETNDAFKSAKYVWHQYGPGSRSMGTNGNGRALSPTWEYVEMFPWADGRNFDFSKLSNAEKDEMFTIPNDTKDSKGNLVTGSILTRDPRLYENVIVNGVQSSLDWSNGSMSGNAYELWTLGSDIQTGVQQQSGGFATGFGNNKYFLGQDALRKNVHWGAIRLSDIYLTYAEALLQAYGDNAGALQWVDKVRARVGLKGLAESNPDENLLSDKDKLLDEILRERACELSLEQSRWFDIIRYKLGDKILTKKLHRLIIHRLVDETKDPNDKSNWMDDKSSGFSGTVTWRANTNANSPTGIKNTARPKHFGYEISDITYLSRTWWTGFDSKWYLQPFPLTEVNKGFGLVQNPGW